MNVHEVAEALGATKTAIRKAIARGVLPARLVPGPRGPEYQVEPTDVEAYRANHRKPRRTPDQARSAHDEYLADLAFDSAREDRVFGRG